MKIEILGTGCPNCRRLEALVVEVAAAEKVKPEIAEVTDIPAIMSYGIMHTPGIVIDGELKASGRIPTRSEVAHWLREAAAKA